MAEQLESGNRARNNELLPAVMRGERAAMDEMILSNMAMVKHKVKTFLDTNPGFRFLQGDLISHATLGLVTAVNKMAGVADERAIPLEKEEDKNNPTAFIGTYIYFFIGELLEEESLVFIPARTKRDRKKKGRELFVPTKEGTVDSTYVFEQESQTDPMALTDLMDEVYGACETSLDKLIVEHRSAGRSDQEISDILEVPRSTVQLLRQQIYERFLERTDYD